MPTEKDRVNGALLKIVPLNMHLLSLSENALNDPRIDSAVKVCRKVQLEEKANSYKGTKAAKSV